MMNEQLAQEILQRLTKIEVNTQTFNEWRVEHQAWSQEKATQVEQTLADHTALINKGKGIFWTAQFLWILAMAWLNSKFSGKP